MFVIKDPKPLNFWPLFLLQKNPNMSIVNENKNTYLQTKVPNKALPKIQEVETLETHLQINWTEVISHTSNGAHAKSMIFLKHTTNLKH